MQLTKEEKALLARLKVPGTVKCDNCARMIGALRYEGADEGVNYCSNSCFELGEGKTRSSLERLRKGTDMSIDKKAKATDEAPKKKKKTAPAEEEAPKKKTKASDDDEAPKKKKKHVDADEDEAPKKKAKPADDDADEDEAPKKKKKDRQADADEDADEAPKKKKKDRQVDADESEDDDADEDEAPKKKAKADKPAKAPKKKAKADKGKTELKAGDNPFREGTIRHKFYNRLLQARESGKPKTIEEIFKGLEPGDPRRMLSTASEASKAKTGLEIVREGKGYTLK